jgi:ethylbenzene dioxygenase beta subunit
MDGVTRSPAMQDALLLRMEVEDFLAREAELLDEQRYGEWLTLLTEDVFYWAPAVESVELRRTTSNRVAELDGMAFFKDSLKTLHMRIERLAVGGAWAEIPPSRLCRIVSNVVVDPGATDGEYKVRSKFFLFRSRLEAEEDSYYGSREDVLRRVGGVLKLASRKIVLAQTVLKSRSITTFF